MTDEQIIRREAVKKRKLKPHEMLMMRLTKDLAIRFSSEARFKRLYPGHWQRSSGAWLWVIDDNNSSSSYHQIGSIFRVSDILKAKTIELYTIWWMNGVEVNPK